MGRRKIFILTVVLAAAACLAALFPVLLNAAQHVTLDGSGTIRYEKDAYIPPSNDSEEIEKQEQQLGNSGFVTETNENGDIVLKDNQKSFDGSKPDMTIDYHKQLVENGILSYMRYEGSPCAILNDLIVVLDFSDFYITSFEAQSIDGLALALLGDSNYTSTSFTEPLTIYKPDRTNYDTADTTVSLHGFSDIYVTNGEKREKVNSYSLRILLPGIEGKVITFQKSSLNFATTVIMNPSLDASPKNIAIDLSNMPLTRDAETGRIHGIDLSPEATKSDSYGNAGECYHFHFIGKTENQLEYAFANALDYTETTTHDGYVTEIFIKESTSFSHLYTGIETAVRTNGSGGNITYQRTPTVKIYDAAAYGEPQPDDIYAEVDLFRWLKLVHNGTEHMHQSVSFEHYHRDGDHTIGETVGELECNFDTPALHEGKYYYEVTCSHNEGNGEDPSVLGYFDEEGNVYDGAFALLKPTRIS